MAREEVKNVEMQGQDKVEKRGNLLPEWVAVAVSCRLQNFLIAAATVSKDSIPLSDFFDSSCYGNSKYGILIAAAMGHRYENSAAFNFAEGYV